MSSPAIWGVDPDTVRITVVTGSRADPEIFRIPLDPGSGHTKSCGLAFRGLCEFIGEEKQQAGKNPIIYLEAPVVGQGGPGPTISQAQIGGSLMACAEEMQTSLTLVNNQTWKKRVTGHGNINKDQVNEWMKDNWPEIYKAAKGHLPLCGAGPKRDQNIIDAGAIYLFGIFNYELKKRIIKRRKKSG